MILFFTMLNRGQKDAYVAKAPIRELIYKGLDTTLTRHDKWYLYPLDGLTLQELKGLRASLFSTPDAFTAATVSVTPSL